MHWRLLVLRYDKQKGQLQLSCTNFLLFFPPLSFLLDCSKIQIPEVVGPFNRCSTAKSITYATERDQRIGVEGVAVGWTRLFLNLDV